jgi:hypothetical protein
VFTIEIDPCPSLPVRPHRPNKHRVDVDLLSTVVLESEKFGHSLLLYSLHTHADSVVDRGAVQLQMRRDIDGGGRASGGHHRQRRFGGAASVRCDRCSVLTDIEALREGPPGWRPFLIANGQGAAVGAMGWPLGQPIGSLKA